MTGFKKYTVNRKPSAAIIVTDGYVNNRQELPFGYGNWIFTSPECEPLQLLGYYASVAEKARHYFKKQGKVFCFVSSNSTKLKRNATI